MTVLRLLSTRTSSVKALVLSLVLLLTLVVLAPAVFAQKKTKKKKPATEKQDKSALQAKKQNLQKDIESTNALLKETRKSKKLSLGQLVVLNKKIEAREELIGTISGEIGGLNKEISENTTAVSSLDEEIKRLKTEYARMVVFAYRNRSAYQRMMFIFSAGNFNQAYKRMKYLQQVSESRRIQSEKINSRQQELNQNIQALESQKTEKQQLLGIEEVEKTSLITDKTDKEKTFNELQSKEKQLKDDLDKKKKQAATTDLAIQRLIQEEAERAAAAAAKQAAKASTKPTAKTQPKSADPKTNPVANNPKPNNPPKANAEPPKLVLTPEAVSLGKGFADNQGSLPWPVAQGSIAERYGRHPHPVLAHVETNNNGVDIATTRGAAARAVFDGEVTGVTNIPGSGWLVIVRHGDYLTVYAQLSEVSVKTGDKVKTKQAIGKVAENDDGGSELHFEVWKSGSGKMNPELWLAKNH
ncbi:MAG: murein hydrolase activator EnvC family protein [Bacteroidia bacterium]